MTTKQRPQAETVQRNEGIGSKADWHNKIHKHRNRGANYAN